MGKKRAVGMPCVRRKVRDPGAMKSEEWCTCKLKVWVFEAKGKLAGDNGCTIGEYRG